ncbi:MAG TPA: S8 family serine peptidase [Solirubrobacteraceae bacterium]
MIRRRTLGVGALAVVAAGPWWATSPAGAEVGAPGATVQAIAADAQFLEYAPPPATPGIVCLVDSGVDPNPDTTPILAGSYATQPGTDTADELSRVTPPLQPGTHPDGHGTYMAMVMAAPVNGWGMVGIAPTSVKVFNLKVLGAGQSTFAFAEYANSIEHCIDGPTGVTGMSVVNLSLGSDDQPSQVDAEALAFAVADVRGRGVDVVGAAGNGGGAVAFPAATDGVLAVGATDANPANLGVFCASSDRGPALGLLAPGCGTQSEAGGGGDGIDAAFSDDGTPAWASGTSEAAAVVSAVLASLRAYDPNLTAAEAEACLTSTVVSGGNLDAAAAFRACGVGIVVSEGMAAYEAAIATPPASTQAGQVPPPAAVPPIKTTLPKSPGALKPWTVRPRVVSVRSRRDGVVVAVESVPRGARLRVDAQRGTGDDRYKTVASTTSGGRFVTVAIRHWDRLAVLFVKGSRRSGVLTVPRGSRLVRVSGAASAANGRRAVHG